MIDPSFLDELHRLTLVVNRNVYSKYSGEHKSLSSGSGTLFKEHRIYTPGDNFKAIDWRVYARTDDLYVKQFEEERNLNVHILTDVSKSMDLDKKFDFAGKVALSFGFLAMKNNERVQFSTFANDLEILKGSKGHKQITSMLDAFNKIKPKGKSQLYQSVHRYKKLIHSKSYVVIISDFLFDLKILENTLHLLGRDHTIKLVQILDPVEKNMDLEGDFKLIDSESDFELRTYISKRAQQQYVEKLDKHVQEIQNIANKFPGTKFYQFTTDRKMFDVLFSITNDRF
ncbi:DUF58 domain-containing protein [Candidatus Woesearchaeota archaeon]|nr:DUF58 domain-containing protein [Candidatus Woesearchaeota archaeon]